VSAAGGRGGRQAGRQAGALAGLQVQARQALAAAPRRSHSLASPALALRLEPPAQWLACTRHIWGIHAAAALSQALAGEVAQCCCPP
jgi:hypothetical protein